MDLYPSIDLDDAQVAIKQFLVLQYGNVAGCFLHELVLMILRHKFFNVSVKRCSSVYGCVQRGFCVCSSSKFVLHKCESLSIGEHIATAAANIYRHHKIVHVVSSFATSPDCALVRHYGYVDDTLTLLIARSCTVSRFITSIDVAISPMIWEHSHSTSAQDFFGFAHKDCPER